MKYLGISIKSSFKNAALICVYLLAQKTAWMKEGGVVFELFTYT